MDHSIANEESYADRRRLFKNVWDTTMQVNAKDNVLGKRKVVKTLRLDDIDRSLIEKKKKQKIKNLRAVCKKLLATCDNPDADDKFFEQMVTQSRQNPFHNIRRKPYRKESKLNKIKVN